MAEVWRDIENFPGYQVSNQGRVRSFWKKKRCPTGYGTYRCLSDVPMVMPQSDDGNGYAKVMLYSKIDGQRYCKKVHRLVAEAFIPCPSNEYTVDHIRSGPEGKRDNNVYNLRWVTRADNIKKAYRDGMCDRRIAHQNKSIVAVDLWTGEEQYFNSIKEASEELGIHRTSISHVLSGDYEHTSHYTFEYAGREERLLYGHDDWDDWDDN